MLKFQYGILIFTMECTRSRNNADCEVILLNPGQLYSKILVNTTKLKLKTRTIKINSLPVLLGALAILFCRYCSLAIATKLLNPK